jgi:beta-galactosidase GanA
MKFHFWTLFLWASIWCLVGCNSTSNSTGNSPISYDRRALLLNGQRTLLLVGSVHYARSSPSSWPGLFQACLDGGINMIDTYVFWSLHEKEQGMYEFGELIAFLKMAASFGLLVHLRYVAVLTSVFIYI